MLNLRLFIVEDWLVQLKLIRTISFVIAFATWALPYQMTFAQKHIEPLSSKHPVLEVNLVDTSRVDKTVRGIAEREFRAINKRTPTLKGKNPIFLVFLVDSKLFKVEFIDSTAALPFSKKDSSAGDSPSAKEFLPFSKSDTVHARGEEISTDPPATAYVVKRTTGTGFLVKVAHTKSKTIAFDSRDTRQEIFYFNIKTSPPSNFIEYLPDGSFEITATVNGKATRDTVTVDSLCVGFSEVTNAQFRDFINKKEISANKDSVVKTWLNWESPYCQIKLDSGRYAVKSREYERHPVVEVTWQGAKAFCAWLKEIEHQEYRLPYEKEWLLAATNYDPTRLRQPVLQDTMLIGAGNFDGKSGEDIWEGTAPVNTLAKNADSLFHFAGNVREWCEDSYQEEFKGDPPSTPSKSGLRVVRGGSWVLSSEYARLSFRDGMHQDSSAFDIGFRVVIDHNKPNQ